MQGKVLESTMEEVIQARRDDMLGENEQPDSGEGNRPGKRKFMDDEAREGNQYDEDAAVDNKLELEEEAISNEIQFLEQERIELMNRKRRITQARRRITRLKGDMDNLRKSITRGLWF